MRQGLPTTLVVQDTYEDYDGVTVVQINSTDDNAIEAAVCYLECGEWDNPAVAAELVRRWNAFPALLDLARSLAAAATDTDRRNLAARAAVLAPEGPGLTDGDDWRLDEALSGRR
jgi:hypothetical protein